MFLDIVADRYFMLPQEQADHFLDMIRDLDHADPSPLFASLFSQCDGVSAVDPTTTNVLHEGIPPAERRINISMLAVLWTHVSAWRMLRTLPFEQVLQRIASPIANRGDGRDIVRRAKEFGSSDALIDRHDRCLLKTVAMAIYLRRHGMQPTMVLGVTLNPFRAHCWLQSDAVLLNETPEVVRNFTPILVVN